ncbi:MAG: ABC transporter ATP-binding protein [Plectolyngbya sp. WJT66-NPBG17]|jgi:NitT/TauT family transport system ATP-binding protein|nr:ABC transporter ATP-binding protein [Plectolyngbya sp. WJT66-NPBG17]MBW4528471.1 ABC transporter ATP-binding protein [Phormidium tanganyikae FI6-MK23]
MLNTRPQELQQRSQAQIASDLSPAKLEVRGLSKSFTLQNVAMTVLEDINFQLFSREFVCLVGASGCGKSTLLNIVAGLAAPSSGSVLVDGREVTGPGSDRGMVFQNYTLYPWLTVSQNIAFGLKLRKMPRAEQRDRIDYYLNVVGLTQFAKSYPKQLSGGMKQRVAIARALANEPAVLLMDEPFGALDAQTKEQMQQFLLELWEQTHVTVLMITHDVEEAIFLSQRVYVMSARPGRMKLEVPVGLPEHRDLEMKLSAEFVEIKRQILHSLRE